MQSSANTVNQVNERRVSIGTGALIGGVGAIPVVALSYAGAQLLNLPQPYSDLFEKLTRILPGSVLTFAIDTMVSIFSRLPGVSIATASKDAEMAIAVIQFVILGGIFGGIIAWALRRVRWQGAYVGLAVSLIPLIVTLLIENFNTGNAAGPATGSIWVLGLICGWGLFVGTTLETLSSLSKSSTSEPEVVNSSRRTFLIRFGGGAAALSILAWGFGRLYNSLSSNGAQAVAAGPSPTPTLPPPVANGTPGAFAAAPGTRLENTQNDQFYRVDVNLEPPQADPTKWNLSITGLVDNGYTLSYDQLKALPATEQDATLECISNPVGGNLISSTHWTGVKLSDLLKKAGLKPEVTEIKFTCLDGYTESLPLQSAMDDQTLVAYAMNGQPLLPEHGFPARIYTPNRYGMKNPKWLTTIEAINTSYNGYWEDEGWNKDAIVKTTSVIDAIDTDQAQNGVVPVGGIAFAGARGIQKVEVSVDGGDWQAAQLKDPISSLTWRLWRFDWQAAKGHHNVVVRATDGTGTLQTDQEAPLHPDGASGYFSQPANL